MDIQAEVKKIIKNHFDVDDAALKPEASFIEDLKADSLALVELTLEFESKFEITIPQDDVVKIRTVQDAISYIEAARAKKS